MDRFSDEELYALLVAVLRAINDDRDVEALARETVNRRNSSEDGV